MIDCKDFQFATASLTGGPWFYQTITRYGIDAIGYHGGLLGLFENNKNESNLKVSLVRHPCDWLGMCYKTILLNCLS